MSATQIILLVAIGLANLVLAMNVREFLRLSRRRRELEAFIEDSRLRDLQERNARGGE